MKTTRLTGLLLLLVLVLAVTSGVLAWQTLEARDDLHEARALTHAQQDAARAAREFAELVATYSPETLDSQFEKVLDRTTGQFQSQYRSASTSLEESIVKLKGTSAGKVLEVGVVSATRRRAEVMVFVDQVVKNSQLQQPRTDRARMRLVLVLKHGRWLVSELKLV